MIGTQVGQYRIGKLIGEGGMGAVYVAEHMLLGRPAAVKVLLPELSRNQEIVTRFFNEARAATAIRHPSIVEIYDFGFHGDGSAYIVMEKLEGESLAARMARARLPARQAGQIAIALGAAHAKEIVHRDLKPDNVFLVKDPEVPGGERVKLLDFGIAKLTGDSMVSQKTRTGAVMGTPTYMAPEQCRGVTVDHRADLYSLGCMLFEMLTGRAPFVGEGTGDVLAAHIHVAPPAVASLLPDVPPALEAIVGRLLAKQPGDRPQTADEVVAALDRFGTSAFRAESQAGHELASSSFAQLAAAPTTLSGAAAAVATTSPPAPRKRGGMLIGLAAAGVGVAAAIAVVMLASGSDEPAAQAAASPPQPIAPVAAPPPVVAPPASAPAPAAAPADEVAPAAPTEFPIRIESIPPGATVLVDGMRVGNTPYVATRAVRAGEVEISLQLEGFEPVSVRADGSQPIERTISLEEKASQTPAHRAKSKRRGPARGEAPAAERDRDDAVNPFE